MTEEGRLRLWAAVIFLATVAVYAPSLGNGFLTIWDDPDYVTGNPDIRGLSAANIEAAFTRAYVGNYAPLHILSYALDYTLFGLNPLTFRAVSLAIHALNGILVLFLVRRLSGNLTLAGLAALIFALHPVQAESVAWVSERKNVLSTAFMLLAIFLYLRFHRRRSWTAYCGALLLFAAALLTKVSVVIAPVLLCLYVFLFGERRLARFLEILPFFLLSAGGIAGALITQDRALVPYHGGSAFATALTSATLVVRYLGLFLVPVALSPDYEPPVYDHFTLAVILSLALLAALAAVLWIRRRDREGLFWAGWAFVSLLPVLHVVPLVTLMNNRYLYLPLIGLAPLAVKTAGMLGRRGQVIVTGVFVLAILPQTVYQATLYDAGPRLWLDAIEHYPEDPELYINLASVYVHEGNREAARDAYMKAISLLPHTPRLRQEVAGYLMKIRCDREALVVLKALYDSGRWNAALVSDLGYAYLNTGDVERGLRCHAEVLARNPTHANSLYGMAIGHERRGEWEQAIGYWRRFLAITPPSNPWWAKARVRLDRALAELRKAKPSDR